MSDGKGNEISEVVESSVTFACITILKGLFRLKEKRLSDDGYEIHEIEEEGRAYSYIERHWLGEI